MRAKEWGVGSVTILVAHVKGCFASRPKGRRPDPAPMLDKQISCRQSKLATG